MSYRTWQRPPGEDAVATPRVEVALAGPRREQHQDPRAARARERVALAGLEPHQPARAELEPLAAARRPARCPRRRRPTRSPSPGARRAPGPGVSTTSTARVPSSWCTTYGSRVPRAASTASRSQCCMGADVPISRLGRPMASEKFQAPRGTHDVLPSETRWWAPVRAIEEQARALRLRPDPDARLRGHGALPAHLRRGLGRGAQGDVHVHRPRRPLADAAARGHRADRARLPRARPQRASRSR